MVRTLGYSFDYFIDSSRQLATKRIGHKKFWNVVGHVFGSWIVAWAVLFLGGQYLPFYFQCFLVVVKLLICIIQEPPAGFAYSLVYCLLGYHAVLVEHGTTIFQGLLVLAVGFGLNLASHLMFEGIQSLERYKKGNDLLFQFCDLINEFLFQEFHFGLLFILRMGLLPVLEWRSDVDLRKALDKIAMIKKGHHGP